MIHINPVCGLRPAISADPESGARALPQRKQPSTSTPDRWSILSQLVIARDAFGLTDRDIAVLRALISCLPKNDPTSTFVFASNRTLSARAEGMHERTLRRHLANLVNSGLVTKQNSPNLKRYVRRDRSGAIVRAFGFDLSMLWARSDDICTIAAQATDEATEVELLREELSLTRQKILASHPATAEMGDIAEGIRKACRRKLSANDLQAIISNLFEMLPCLSQPLQTPTDAPVVSASDSQNVRHQQSSKKDISESEALAERANPERPHNLGRKDAMNIEKSGRLLRQQRPNPASPERSEELGPMVPSAPALPLVMEACPESLSFAIDHVRTWCDLIRFSDILAPMVRIGRDLLEEARRSMGTVEAAVAVMCIVQMGSKVRSPGAYLRTLSNMAMLGNFSTNAMVRALLRQVYTSRLPL